MKLMFWVEETDLKRFVWRFLFQSQQHDQRYCNGVQPTCNPVAFNVCFEDGGQTCDLSQAVAVKHKVSLEEVKL